jgi:hypothetical protein
MAEYRPCPRLPADRYRFGSDGSAWYNRHRGGRRHRATWRRLTVRPHAPPGGAAYASIQVAIGGRVRSLHLGPLILSAFGQPRPLGSECSHIDGDRMNCRLDNLEWRRKNHRLRHRIRGRMRGEGHPRHRLDEKAVIEDRREYARGAVSVAALARRRGVHPTTMRAALRGDTWVGLPGAVPIRPRSVYGSAVGTAELDDAEVATIKADLAAGVRPAALARRHGVSRQAIYRIRDGLTWIHVAAPAGAS